ncbi:MAG: ArsR/SmtB family transcription factor [Planctomycetota bacterium]|jgi:DNA-binding transcriptional ArsR family regulator
MRELLAVMKALADENRLRIVVALQGRELCLCQIVELLGLASSTVSRHMSILHQARLVESRKDGRWSYFRLAGKAGPPEAAKAAALVIKSLDHDEKARGDAKRLKQILRMDPEVLCRKQSACKC